MVFFLLLFMMMLMNLFISWELYRGFGRILCLGIFLCFGIFWCFLVGVVYVFVGGESNWFGFCFSGV